MSSVFDLVSLVQHPEIAAGVATGYVSTSATNTVAVRATAYAPQAANGQRSIVSTSALDTNTAGTGARTVKLTYLSIDLASVKTETIALNGLTAVNTVATDIALIEKIEVLTAGSGGSNAGTISVMTLVAGGGTAMGSIAVGDNRTFWAHHYVPVGKTCYLFSLTGGGTAVSGRLIPIKAEALASAAPNPISLIASTYLYGPQNAAGYPPVDHTFAAPLAVVGPALITLNCRPDAVTASNTHASFEYVEF